VADIDLSGAVSGGRRLLGDEHTNYQEPTWSSDNRLFVLADTSDWWNVYEVDVEKGALTVNVYPVDDDLGRTRWIFGTYNKLFDIDGSTCVIAHENVSALPYTYSTPSSVWSSATCRRARVVS